MPLNIFCFYFRLKVQHESLRKEEMEQNELIEQFLLQK